MNNQTTPSVTGGNDPASQADVEMPSVQGNDESHGKKRRYSVSGVPTGTRTATNETEEVGVGLMDSLVIEHQ